MTHLWCNGQWLDPLDFPISPTDRGLTNGLGLFETILAIDGRPIFADRHLARFQSSCERLGWQFEFPDINETMVELIRLNELTEGRSRIRLAITAGSGLLRILTLGSDHLAWMAAARMEDVPESTTANLSPWTRNEHSAVVGLKCASYAENLVALQHADRLGFQETVFLNNAGNVCEAATANVFLVKNGTLVTPTLESGCLPGITRSVVIELSENLGIPCDERQLSEAELRAADELFLTSSVRGVMAVVRFEDRRLMPGPVTERLREAWNAAILGKNAV